MASTLYFPNETSPLIKLVAYNPQKPRNFLLEFISPPDNRLTLAFLDSFNKALDHIEAQLALVPKGDRKSGGASLITASSGKFYSNGLSIEELMKYPNHFGNALTPVLARFMNLGLPTIAAVNGHAFAGGCMLALVHDYAVMNSDKGFMCLNEVDLDFQLPVGIPELIRSKASAPKFVTKMALEGHRFSGKEALEAGFVDYAVPSDKVIEVAKQIADKVSSKVIGNGKTVFLIKAERNRHVVEMMMGGQNEVPASYLSKL
ncbi:Enoyl-CoA delta isomerase 1, peroxisomal [Smittium culicis]|uniref:Enoyl-CoA delta isomerase 1, peroxisomal n=1 Tax=Smittium culicis TaxID=133412 RepID=A0A1R1XVX7_9FUNG|nr:Enoyl-CoA delta isomerase 1, peroxisomal [Smittium culicis]OMJ13352.1 Enoyl-CoA delta isomerase 1, peroxisomal [Smittium culicis]OMJ18790.1 Enoyl-CoA delta isomerase 1, peroxisomal [Smittium culicis]